MTGAHTRPVGRIKHLPADFLVEEVPAYLPSGAGEHLYLHVEKRDFPAEQLLRHVARTLGISPSDIGCAGMKDRRAITRQWISVPAKLAEHVDQIASDQIQILDRGLHGNKLRTGHLHGNRFDILVRDPAPTETSAAASFAASEASLRSAIARIERFGFANYFGDQRFGRAGETLQLGRDLLSGARTPKDIPYARRRFLLKLSLSAVQSDLFNQVLADRIQRDLATTVLAGDVMEVVASGGKFVVEDAAAEQARCDAGETAITGPMFGAKMKSPEGEPAQVEARILSAAGLTPEAFRGFGDLLSGTRRRLLIRPTDLAASMESAGLRLKFTLPAGVYATTLLDELFDCVLGEASIAAPTEQPEGE